MLDLRGNLLCESRAYRGLLLRRLTKLSLLDGVTVTQQERDSASEGSSALTPGLIKLCVAQAAARGDGGPQLRPRHQSSESSAAAAAGGGGEGEGAEGAGEDAATPEYWDSVEQLVVERQQLRRLASLSPLCRLWRASFAGNELARIEGLEQCTQLEELSLEDNRITQARP